MSAAPRGSGVRGGVAIESPKAARESAYRLLRYFGAEWPSLIVVGAAIVAGSVFKALGPAFLGQAITDHIERNPDPVAFATAMAGVAGLFVLGWIADAVNGGFMTRAANRLVYRLRQTAFSHLQRLSMSYFDRVGVGDLVSRVTNDIEMIYNALTSGFANMLGGLVSIFGILIAMLVLDVRLSLVVVALLPVLMLTTTIIGRMVRRSYRENQKLIGQLSGMVNESVHAARMITSFHTESETFERFQQVSREARRAGTRAEVFGFAVHPVMRIINGVTAGLVVGVGGYLAVTVGSPYSVGLITTFVIYSRRFFEPLRQLSELYNLLQRSLAGAERVFEVLDSEPEIVNADAPKYGLPAAGAVDFQGVHFEYAQGRNVLNGLNLSVRSGQVVALVGPTGAGKTTLVNLLSRFYDVTGGRILIDGVDVREIDLDSLRSRMGVVLQEPWFFADTILENLRYGKPDATEEQVAGAARTAGADHFIRRLPEGYNTPLVERGANLSEGERQLLAIARAVLADPRLLILDEATSSVDSLTEKQIRDSVTRLMKGRTSFIIAHRLSTIRHADLVAVIHDHAIVESGTHEELMEHGGYYARLYRQQFELAEITEDMDI